MSKLLDTLMQELMESVFREPKEIDHVGLIHAQTGADEEGDVKSPYENMITPRGSSLYSDDPLQSMINKRKGV